MSTLDDLLQTIFDDDKPGFYAEFERWVKANRRYKAFATTYNTKIRSKLKNARDDHSIKDLRAELETAALLLSEERFTVEYETYVALKQRGPDFTVTFKSHTRLNIEVRRLRGIDLAQAASETQRHKLMAVICDKVGQMPPGIINLLWLTAEQPVVEHDFSAAMLALRQMTEQKNQAYFQNRGFKDAADFLRQYRQLSGVILRHSSASSLWLNPLAKHNLPPDLTNTLRRLASLA